MKRQINISRVLDCISLGMITFALLVSFYLTSHYPELQNCHFCTTVRALHRVLLIVYFWRIFIGSRLLSESIQLLTASIGLGVVLHQLYQSPERLKVVLNSLLYGNSTVNFKFLLSSYLSIGSFFLFLWVILFSFVQFNWLQIFVQSKKE